MLRFGIASACARYCCFYLPLWYGGVWGGGNGSGRARAAQIDLTSDASNDPTRNLSPSGRDNWEMRQMLCRKETRELYRIIQNQLKSHLRFGLIRKTGQFTQSSYPYSGAWTRPVDYWLPIGYWFFALGYWTSIRVPSRRSRRPRRGSRLQTES